MNTDTVIQHIDRLVRELQASGQKTAQARGVQAQACEFLKKIAGPKSSFYEAAQRDYGVSTAISVEHVLLNYRSYVEAGLADEISPIRRAQLDVVSDFLQQAQTLLAAKDVHPATPIVLVGATLEEFLRNWVEAKGLSLSQRKPSLDSYAQVLFADSAITKQDVKDITAWGGLRNHAAHGEWTEVSDRQRASIMLEGVNLFMRKYGAA
jgi:hypothetical protein